jgi:Tfp pilus assembly pilus retraction ATPase PilT
MNDTRDEPATADPDVLQPIPEAPLDVSDLDRITDIYLPNVPIDGTAADSPAAGAFVFAGSPQALWTRGTPLGRFLDVMAEHIKAYHPDATDFTVDFQGYTYRASRSTATMSELINLRRTPPECPSLADLNLPPMWSQVLTSPALQSGGLVVFAAETGQGKSTTACAMIRSRLEKFGGFAWTVEDPAELPLSGRYGNGVCMQSSVNWHHPDEKERGWSGALRAALRKFPTSRGNILFVGEVRDGETAAELIQAAINGMLVITTVHALSVPAAVQRLVSLANRRLDQIAPDLLSSALRIVVTQHLSLRAHQTGWKRGAIDGRLVYCDGESHPIAVAIRERKFQQILQSVRYQETVLKMSGTRQQSVADLLKDLGSSPGVR